MACVPNKDHQVLTQWSGSGSGGKHEYSQLKESSCGTKRELLWLVCRNRLKRQEPHEHVENMELSPHGNALSRRAHEPI